MKTEESDVPRKGAGERVMSWTITWKSSDGKQMLEQDNPETRGIQKIYPSCVCVSL